MMNLLENAHSPNSGIAGLLADSTNDVMSNIFDVCIQWPLNFGDGLNDSEVSYRCEGLTPPAQKMDTYDVTWHGIKVQKIKTGANIERHFDLTFRLGSNWLLYQRFIYWIKYMNDVNTGASGNSEIRGGRIFLYAPAREYNTQQFYYNKKDVTSEIPEPENLNGNGDNWLLSRPENMEVSKILVWAFNQVLPTTIDSPQFKNEASGAPQKFKVSFICGDIWYPFWGFNQ